jgi:hypothetical protein
MINFMLPEYLTMRTMIYQQLSMAQAGIQGHDVGLDGRDKDGLREDMQLPIKVAIKYGLEIAQSRLERIMSLAQYDNILTRGEVVRQMQTLLEAFDDDTKLLYLYAYPKDRVRVFVSFDNQWQHALRAFPTIEKPARAAADLYALGHNDACVFHLMQTLEKGLAALAVDVGLTFDVQYWENIIGAIEGKISRMQKNGIGGLGKREKDERLQFLSEAAAEFRYFKDGWRNYVSHGRGDYDHSQALGVLEHVRSFMNHLSTRLSE